MEKWIDALADQDVDRLRRQLRELSGAPPTPTLAEEEVDDPAVALARSVAGMADHLLKLGLPHLEREAAAAESAAAASTASHWPLMVVPELGLTLRAQPVMGHAMWPAALALGKFLMEHKDLCVGARVIELGAGGAAPGLVARASGASFLLATDGDESLVQLIAANCESNSGGDWSAAVLDWRDVAALNREGSGSWDLVLASDVLYSAGELVPIARACNVLLRSTPRSRVLLSCSAWFEGFQPTLLQAFEEEGFGLVSQSVCGQNTTSDTSAAVVLELSLLSRERASL